jgi:nicotinamidase-related amidase
VAELRIDPAKTALVLIDLQNAVLSRESSPHTTGQVVENGRKLAEAFREKGATGLCCNFRERAGVALAGRPFLKFTRPARTIYR